MSNSPKKSYGQILKSSALIGGSSAVTILFGIIRTKVLALLLGPSGVGLLGIFNSIVELAQGVAGMGLNSSGVRQIAEAVGSGDTQRIARTVTTLRRVALYLGILGALLVVALSKPISWLAFKDGQHAGAVALLSVAVFCGALAAAQSALVQGMRQIASLARIAVLGALYGTLISIPIVYFFGVKGIVPSLICVAAMNILTTWWFSRKIRVARVDMAVAEVFSEASELLKLGLVFMAAGFMTLGSAFLIRVFLAREIGVDAAGFYQAAWALGGLYLGFVLQAMGADFYPRLTAVANDNPECNRLVNEQTEVGMLLAVPATLAMMGLAPMVIQAVYSPLFLPSVEIFRWFCLGMMVRVSAWPMGFIFLAKGARKLFFWSELAANLIHLGLMWLLVKRFGQVGTGMAFFGMYVLYWITLYAIFRRLTGFRWSDENRRVGLVCFSLVLGLFVCSQFLPLPESVVMALGVITATGMGIYSLKKLCALVPLERMPRIARKLIIFLRFAPASADV